MSGLRAQDYPPLDTSGMSDDLQAAYAIACKTCRVPAYRRCDSGIYGYVPMPYPHETRITEGLAAREETP